MKRVIICFAFFGVAVYLSNPTAAFAEVKTFRRTVKEAFLGSQFPDATRLAAVAKARREALAEAVSYLQHLSVVKKRSPAENEIPALATALSAAKIISQKDYATVDAFGTAVIVEVELDTKNLEKGMNRLFQDPGLLEQYGEVLDRERVLIGRLESLKRGLRASPGSSLKDNKGEGRRPVTQLRELARAFSAIEWNRKALALWENGGYSDPRLAVEHLNRCIRLDPSWAAAYNNRGIAWEKKGYHNLAIADYRKALDIDPRYAAAHYNRGVAWSNKGACEQAGADYRKALDIDPRYAAAMNALARLLATCPETKYRNGSKAVELALRALELVQDVRYLDTLAAAYVEAGEPEAAKAIRQKAAALRKKKVREKASFNISEVSGLLGCSQDTIIRAIEDGELKASRVGNVYAVLRSDLEAFWVRRGGGKLF